MFAVTKVGLVAISVCAWIASAEPQMSPTRIAHLWASQWDSGWFAPIAAVGYPDTADDRHAAFFPLYPALIWVTKPLFAGNVWWAGLAVANAALLVALVVLHRLTEHEFGADVAGRTTFLLLAYPTGFFLTAAYNEGLFIALLACSLYAMRRGHWWLAGALGGLAATTRSAGILLVAVFAFEYLRRHGWGRRVGPSVLAGALIPAGTGAVMVLNQILFDDALAFSRAQTAVWGRELSWPWTAVTGAAGNVNPFNPRIPLFGSVWVHNALELGTVLLLFAVLALMVVGPWRLPVDQLVLPLAGLLVTTFMVIFPPLNNAATSYPLLSTSRIGLEAVPAFMMLGVLTANRTLERLLLVTFLPLQGLLVTHFLHSQWVA